MKNQVLLTLTLCLVLPCLAPVAFRMGTRQADRPVSVSCPVGPLQTGYSLSAAGIYNTGNQAPVLTNHRVLQNKQINCWIP
jgi:hypothetical protein